MNIAQAKDEIKHTVQAYLKKDAQGNYRIPAIRQRPILLIGPPGIGKITFNRGTGNRKDTDHGADRRGMRCGTGGLHDHAPHSPECGRSADDHAGNL